MQATGRMPVAGLRALLEQSLDYAGLFPPAKLPLETAIKNYAKYRLGSDTWFLSGFVCPIDRLHELNDFLPRFAKSVPLLVSALAPASGTWREFTTKLRQSLGVIFRFQHAHPGRVRVGAIEIPLPADVTNMVGAVETQELIDAAVEDIELSGLRGITPFFEVTATDWHRDTAATIRAIAQHNQSSNGLYCGPAAFKLRTGGAKPEAFPVIDQLTFVLMTCLDSGTRFKCTAGLHHPVRHFDESVGTKMHGFLNIFGAATLVHARAISRNDLPSILEDEDPSHFAFDKDGFKWKDVHATVEQISEARRNLLVSFGSCSFEEPLEDLRKLGVL